MSFQKRDTSVCSNNRGITLRFTTPFHSKLFQIVVLNRLSKGPEGAMRENQCGFRRNRSCVNQILSLRAMIIPLYVNFIDFKSAFDCINRNFIWMANDTIMDCQNNMSGHISIFRWNCECSKT